MTNANEMMKITDEGRKRLSDRRNKRARRLIKRMRKEALKGNDYCYVPADQIDVGVCEILSDAGYKIEHKSSSVRKITWGN